MDLETAKKEFLNYTSNYDSTDFHIKRKIDHSLRVMDISKSIAESLNLSEEEIDLAVLIGLLHDIGRFEQRRIYNTFIDEKSIDHGDLGIEILKKNNYIRNYIKEDTYDEIIYLAIKNHNKYAVEEGIDDSARIFCNIIRDADKIDIIYQATCISWSDKEEIENALITEKDIIPLMDHRMVDREKDLIDKGYPIVGFIGILGFIFDINYKKSFEILKEEDYINIELIKKLESSYIDDKIKG